MTAARKIATPDRAPAYTTEIPIRFQHCDPAGIVFYPRFFEFTNQTVEDWFAEGLSMPFARLHGERGLGVPTVHIEADFLAPLRLGERALFSLYIDRQGRSALDLTIVARRDGEDCLRARVTLAFVEMKRMRAVPIPDDLRATIAAHESETAEI